jgi:hypothetical protein
MGGGRDRLFAKSRNRIAQRQSIRPPTESGMAAIYTGIPTVGEWQAPQVRRVAPPPTRVRGYAVVAGSIVFRRDLLNKPDNSAAQFRVWDGSTGEMQKSTTRKVCCIRPERMALQPGLDWTTLRPPGF